jgi:1-acyl-sn-glycerol-3-phosphate acyltransferase
MERKRLASAMIALSLGGDVILVATSPGIGVPVLMVDLFVSLVVVGWHMGPKQTEWPFVAKVLRAIGGFIQRVFLNVRVKGHVPGKGPFIIAPNHLSDMDGPLMLVLCKDRATFFINGRHYEMPFLKPLFKHLGLIPVWKHKSGGEAIASGLAALRAGTSVVIFPEGRRSRRGDMLRFRRGVAVLAIKSGCPVIPVAICGTDRSLPPGSVWIPGRFPVSVTIGKPMYIESDETVEEFADRVRVAVWLLGKRDKAYVSQIPAAAGVI